MLRLFLTALTAPIFLPVAALAEDPVQTVPSMWFTESAEVMATTLRNHPELPRPELVGMLEDDSIANDHYIIRVQFAKKTDDGIFVLFDSGALVKFDFLEGETKWRIQISPDTREFALSEDGLSLAVSAGADVLMFSTSDGSPKGRTEDACSGPCTALALSKDGHHLIVGDANGFVRVIQITGSATRWERKVHQWPVRTLLLIEQEAKRFLVSSDGTEMVLFDLASEEERRRLHGRHSLDGYHDFWINSISAVPKTNFFVIGGYEDVYVIDAESTRTVKTYTGAGQAILRAYAGEDLSRVVGISRDRVIYSWESDLGHVASSHWMETGLFAQFIDTAISPDGLYTAAASFEPQIAIPPRAVSRVRVYKRPN